MAMSKKRADTLRKHADIRADYAKMAKQTTSSGKRIYTNAYIFEKLSERYYMSESSVERIIYSCG